MGLFPAFLLCNLGIIDQHKAAYFASALAAVILCLLVHFTLTKWHHGGLLVLLTLGLPPMGYVFVAVRQPVFMPLLGVALVVALTAALVGCLAGGTWSWQGIGINLAFLLSVAMLIISLGSVLGVAYVESGLIAAGAFSITHLCQIDLLSGFSLLPNLIYRGLEKLWR